MHIIVQQNISYVQILSLSTLQYSSEIIQKLYYLTIHVIEIEFVKLNTISRLQ